MGAAMFIESILIFLRRAWRRVFKKIIKSNYFGGCVCLFAAWVFALNFIAFVEN